MTEEEFLRAIQRYVAVSAIGVTAVRGSTRGVLKAARTFAAELDLTQFSVADKARFRATLDAETERLQHCLPVGGQAWGVARKALNLFLRDAFYNYYLRTAFELTRAESWFEVPLDSMVAASLLKRNPRAAVPAWSTVKALSPSKNAEYQEALRALGARLGVAAVHLDSMLWLEGTGAAPPNQRLERPAARPTRHDRAAVGAGRPLNRRSLVAREKG
jgi:hypothetical protein